MCITYQMRSLIAIIKSGLNVTSNLGVLLFNKRGAKPCNGRVPKVID